MSEAKNVKAIRKWVAEHRPDVMGSIEEILRGEAAGRQPGTGMFFLLAIGFAAGRKYQRENPDDTSP